MNFHFINQLEYTHIPYYTSLDFGGLPEEKNNIAYSGCGLCCFVMGIEACTGKRIKLEEAVRLSEKYAANRHHGTDLEILFQHSARDYGLDFQMTNHSGVLRKWLEDGGIAVANPSGNRDGYVCPFCDRGHYLFVYALKGNVCTVYDTAWKEGKFDSAVKDGSVKLHHDNTLETTLEVLDEACLTKNPRYCLVKKCSNYLEPVVKNNVKEL